MSEYIEKLEALTVEWALLPMRYWSGIFAAIVKGAVKP